MKLHFLLFKSSDKNNLHFGTIICALGVRYKYYCANIVRTMLVEPSEKIQDTYKYLLTLEDELVNNLYEGVKLNELYEKIRSKVQSDKPELVDKLINNFGFSIGIEFREPNYLIGNKCTAVAKKGMAFQLSIGFQDLINDNAKDDESKKYALFIGDTVIVNGENEPATILTIKSKKKIENIGIFLKDEDEEEDEDETNDTKSKEKVPELLTRGTRSAVLTNKTRTDNTNASAREKHQKELAKRLNEEARERILNQKGEKTKEKTRKAVSSYKNPSQVPFSKPEIEELKIYVDKHHETVILPIFGSPVPFHVSTIKNLSTSVEGDFTYLRVNFHLPGVAVNKNTQQVQEEGASLANSDCVFVKEITYRATNNKEPGEISPPSTNLNLAFKYIKEMQKEFKEKEHEEKEKEGMVKQDNLVLSTNKANPKLKDLQLKPSTVQKRIPGTLEAHTNGFLYTSVRGDKVEILYNNIKHAIFQPCDKEIVILLHFHLKYPILMGKKKQFDIQFYTDVGETITDLGKHNRGGDRDDLIAEQAERELRKKLNLAFKSFIDKVEQITNNQISFEVPYRDLLFNGTPYRSMVSLQPTSSCLINVTEWPPFILTLDQVELVHFERVGFHIKNFDMVFVFKDYTKKVAMITSIPMSQLDQIKDWLNSCDIKYTEGLQNFNWTKIMKTITDDPEGFFENGGWTFLEPESDEEKDEEDDDISDEEDDAYEPTESEDEGDESESEYSDSGDEEDDDDETASIDSDDESGKSWSELEDEARRADEEISDESDHDTKKRKRPADDKKSGTSAKKSKR